MDKINIKNLIIGFGKAGKTLAADLAKHGEEVILVEKSSSMYGGTCINIGCIPSKKLLVEAERKPFRCKSKRLFRTSNGAQKCFDFSFACCQL